MPANADVVFLIRSGANNRPIVEALASVMPYVEQELRSRHSVLESRFKVCGYSDVLSCGLSDWWVEGPFTSNILQAQKEISALDLHNGGDEPESLLDALLKLARMPSSSHDVADSSCWRHSDDARRFVVIFTNSSCHMTTQLPEAAGAGLEDVAQAVTAAKLRILLFAPEAPCYESLAVIDGLEWEFVGDLNDAVSAMAQFASRSNLWAHQIVDHIAKGAGRAEASNVKAVQSEPNPQVVSVVGSHNEREIAKIRDSGLKK